MSTATMTAPTTRIKADKERIDRLKEQLRSTPAEVDFERVRIMAEGYGKPRPRHRELSF